MSSSQSKNSGPPKIFISYSHDSQDHLDRVLALADRLRAEGIDCNLDQYEPAPVEGWPRWMDEQFKGADLILVICTETYCRRFEGREEKGKGLGVKWEGAIITAELYRDETINKRFIPVVFSADDAAYVPERLRDYMRYLVTDDNEYDLLYRRLTDQPRVVRPPLGQVRSLAPVNRLPSLQPENRQQEFTAIEEEPAKPRVDPPRPPPRVAQDDRRAQPTIVQPVAKLPEARKSVAPEPAPPVARKRMMLGGNRWKWLAATGALTLLIWFGATLSRDSAPASQPAPSTSPSTAMPSFAENLGNNLKLEMVNLPGGEFTMGSNEYDDEKPPHPVKVGPFAIGKYEVTQAQWTAVMGDNPSNFKGDDNRPVEQVSWDQAQEFIKRLRDKTRNQTYRLPTEAEWEYAARAGSKSKYSFGDDEGRLGDYAWFTGNSGNQTHPVGRKLPNAWGLYDMHGNVWEWCQDWYDENYYKQSPRENPQGPSSGTYRVLRGGSWGYIFNCRSANRRWYAPVYHYLNVGFRVVCVARTS